MSSTNGVPQPPIDAAQRAQAMEFLQKIMGAKAGGGYVPIIKALNALGVKFKTMEVDDFNDEGPAVECIVIDANDLMVKEWKHMSELDAIKENLGQ